MFILNTIVSFVVGAASSALIAIIFYRLSSRDAEAMHRQSQLDLVSLRLRELDPCAWNDNYRGHYGVDNMIHWLTCMSEIMEESGFIAGRDTLLSIAAEMRQVCTGPNSPCSVTAAEADHKKTGWKLRITELRDIQPRSLLNRK